MKQCAKYRYEYEYRYISYYTDLSYKHQNIHLLANCHCRSAWTRFAAWEPISETCDIARIWPLRWDYQRW